MVNRRFERPPPRIDEKVSKVYLSPAELQRGHARLGEIRTMMQPVAPEELATLRYLKNGNVVLSSRALNWDALLADDTTGKYYVGTKQIADEL